MGQKIKGIFCKEKMARIGTGSTSRRTLQKTYWYVEGDWESFLAWPTTEQCKQVGTPDTLDKTQFAKYFRPELSYPEKRTITLEDINILKKSLEILAGIKDKENADKIIEFIYEQKEELGKKLDTLLLEFGTFLRKSGLFSTALLCYDKLQELGVTSSALYFNIGRVYFELKEYRKCLQNIIEAENYSHEKNESIIQILEYLSTNNLIPNEYKAKVKTILEEKV